jgi:hypothetical protein
MIFIAREVGDRREEVGQAAAIDNAAHLARLAADPLDRRAVDISIPRC